MKILQTISGLDARSGGPSTCTYDLLSSIANIQQGVDLLTLYSEHILGKEDAWMIKLPNDSKTPYAYSSNIRKFLRDSDYDIYHTNGLWLDCNHATCSIARKKHKPYVISPHGMLYPQALRRSYWKKWPLLQLAFHKDIREANCLHASCNQEKDYARAFGYEGPIAVIPNPFLCYEGAELLFERKIEAYQTNSKDRVFGFLGRIHPVKKIENILYAAQLIAKDCDFKIVLLGKGDDEYEAFLKKETDRLGLSGIVEFAGFVKGKEKFERLAQLSALFVPSEFESFGMIVLEALSVGTPVMASLDTPWEDLNAEKCGWWTDNSPETIAGIMKQIIVTPNQDLIDMGARGMNLVKEKYKSDSVAKKMLQLYKWILDGGEKPDFVF